MSVIFLATALHKLAFIALTKTALVQIWFDSVVFAIPSMKLFRLMLLTVSTFV